MTQSKPDKWVGVSGSWRAKSSKLDEDLNREVLAALAEGKGIVTGGALRVDYSATEIALSKYPDGSRLKLILPTTLETYAAHYRKRVKEGVITNKKAEALIIQLERVKKLGSLVEDKRNSEVNLETYYLRNSEVVNASDELLAFQVNKSVGTQDTIDKAKAKGIPVKLFSYTVGDEH